VNYLLDTCLLSEGIKAPVDSGVDDWLAHVEERFRYASVLSLGEIQFGILRLPAGRRRRELGEWYDRELRPSLGTRVLPFDERETIAWSELRLQCPNSKTVDVQIAATALVHGLTVVTRNVKDFAFQGLSVFNPWRK
jgi:predicted nucleic acid-binding protein